MKAIWNGVTLAETDKDNLIYIEGNWYFPPAALHQELFTPSATRTMCYWKGEASYYNIEAGGQTNDDAAWRYAAPMAGSVERVKRDFTNYVAFWRGVEVVA